MLISPGRIGSIGLTRSKGVGLKNVLKREDDGTVTVVQLALPWRTALTREDDGTVTVRAA